MTLYLYAIVGRRPSAGLGVGLRRRPIRFVRVGRLFVAAEECGVPEASAAALRTHDRVVRRIAEHATAVLPFRFGTVAADVTQVASLIEPIASLVTKALARVRGCDQYTLRVLGEPAPRPSTHGGPGTRFLATRLAARQVPEIAPLTKALASIVRETRVERHDRPPLLASVYHLVPRARAPRYLARIAQTSLPVRVTVKGPFPPYAFAELM